MMNKRAFSIGEMMIVLLIISISIAASMPILTKRSKANIDNNIWMTAQNNADAYFNTGDDNGIIIGKSSFPTTEKAKLMLNLASGSDISHILFTKTNLVGVDVLGKIRLASKQLEFGTGGGATGDNSTTYGLSTSAKANATAIGSNANANVNNATAIGYKATAVNDSADNNNSTAVGTESKATESNSTALGYKAEAVEDAVSLGASSKATGSSSVAIGVSVESVGDNSISIGTSTTKARGASSIAIGNNAQIQESANNGIAIGYNSSAATSAIAFGPSATANFESSVAIGQGSTTAAVNEMSIGNNFDNIKVINIGTTGTTIKLAGINAIINGINWTTSDARKKNIIGEYKLSLDDIMKIKTYEFTYKDDLNKTKRVGVIAQELQKIFPNAVTKDNKGYLMIRKEDIFFAIINSIKELNSKIITLEKENRDLRKEIESLSKRIEKLEQAK